jgi:hypothetical protein
LNYDPLKSLTFRIYNEGRWYIFRRIIRHYIRSHVALSSPKKRFTHNTFHLHHTYYIIFQTTFIIYLVNIKNDFITSFSSMYTFIYWNSWYHGYFNCVIWSSKARAAQRKVHKDSIHLQSFAIYVNVVQHKEVFNRPPSFVYIDNLIRRNLGQTGDSSQWLWMKQSTVHDFMVIITLLCIFL